MKKELLYGLIIAVVVVGGAVGIYSLSKRQIKERGPGTAEQTPPAPQSPAKPKLKVTHAFVQDTHTYRGLIDVPTPCFKLSAQAKVVQAEKQRAEIDILASEDQSQGVCAQVVTTKEFSVSFKAPQDVEVIARVNAQDVELVVEQANVSFFDGSKNGFTFSYPLDWTQEGFVPKAPGTFEAFGFKDQGTSTLRIAVSPKLIIPKKSGLKAVKKGKINIADIAADVSSGLEKNGNSYILASNILKDGRYYTIEFDTKLEPSLADAEFRKMLIGLKLIDAGVLYYNEKEGFTLEFPSSWSSIWQKVNVAALSEKSVQKYQITIATTTLFSINVYAKKSWEKTQNVEDEKLIESNNKVFTFFKNKNMPQGFFNDIVNDSTLLSIKNSFRLSQQ